MATTHDNWSLRPSKNADWPLIVKSDGIHGLDPLTGDNVVAVVAHGHEQDARLIAAAPDMLAVCEAVAMYFSDMGSPLGNAAKAAVAKARGG